MKPPVDAPMSAQSRPSTSTPSASSAFRSFSPPRETYARRRVDGELGRLVHLLAGLLVPGHPPREHERLRLAPALGEPALDEQRVEPLLHPPRLLARSLSRSSSS